MSSQPGRHFPPRAPRRARWQFTLVDLLLVVAGCALACPSLGVFFRRWSDGAARRTRVDSIAISADGSTLAGLLRHSEIRVWKLANVDTPVRLTSEWSGTRMALSADGTLLAVAGLLGRGRIAGYGFAIWDVADERCLAQIDGEPPHDFVFSPVEALMARTSSQGVLLERWNGDARAEQALLATGGAEPSAVAFSADGRKLGVALPDDTIQIWDVTNRLPEREYRLPQYFIRGRGKGFLLEGPGQLCFSRDASLLGVAAANVDEFGLESMVRILNLETGETVRSTSRAGVRNVPSTLTFLDDRRLLAVVDGDLEAWDPRTVRPAGRQPVTDDRVDHVVAAVSAPLFVSCGSDHVMLWNARSMQAQWVLFGTQTSIWPWILLFLAVNVFRAGLRGTSSRRYCAICGRTILETISAQPEVSCFRCQRRRHQSGLDAAALRRRVWRGRIRRALLFSSLATGAMVLAWYLRTPNSVDKLLHWLPLAFIPLVLLVGPLARALADRHHAALSSAVKDD